MSNCTRTGAHVFIECYNEYVYGDAFEVVIDVNSGEYEKRVAYFRIVAQGREPINGRAVIHYTVHDFEDWFDRFALDRPSTLITKSFTNHGYEGKKL